MLMVITPPRHNDQSAGGCVGSERRARVAAQGGGAPARIARWASSNIYFNPKSSVIFNGETLEYSCYFQKQIIKFIITFIT